MATPATETILEQVLARLAQLEQENAQLHSKVASLEVMRPAVRAHVSGGSDPAARTSRRGMLKTALGVTVATVGAGALLQTYTGTARAAATFQQSATGSANTAIEGDGTSGATGGTFTSDTGDALYGSSNSGIGVLGGSISGTAVRGNSMTGFGVDAESIHSTAIRGTSGSTAASAAAIVAILDNTAPGIGSAAVSGVNNSTTGNGFGVSGTQAGSGAGVYGFTPSGYGVQAVSQTGTAFYGSCLTGPVIIGTTGSTQDNVNAATFYLRSSTPGANAAAVLGVNEGTTGNGSGVSGTHAGSGVGVIGTAPATGGTGGSFSGDIGLQVNGTMTGMVVNSGGPTGLQIITPSAAPQTFALFAENSCPTPDADSAAVYAYNASTGANGYAIFAKHAGTGTAGYCDSGGNGFYSLATSNGWGARGDSTNGTGIWGTSQTSFGVVGSGTTGGKFVGSGTTGIGVVASGGKYGVSASSSGANNAAILATATSGADCFVGTTDSAHAFVATATTTGSGLKAMSDSGPALKCQSTSSYGGDFAGGLAPAIFRPGTTAGAPTTNHHNPGEFYVDSTGKLFFCVAAGTPGTWKQVMLQ